MFRVLKTCSMFRVLKACSLFRVLKTCFTPFKNFYNQMTDRKYNAVSDVYSIMFAWDFVAFLVIVFGYTSFGPADSTGGKLLRSRGRLSHSSVSTAEETRETLIIRP